MAKARRATAAAKKAKKGKKAKKAKAKTAKKAKTPSRKKTVKSGRARATSLVKRRGAKKTAKETARRAPARKAGGRRLGWLDDKTKTPAIDGYARRLSSFMKALADGKVDRAEVAEQEARLVALMEEVEPLLDARLHAKVTELLCELTAYDIMRILHSLEEARPVTRFQG